MGRQVGFYMVGSGEEDFVKFLRSDCNVGIFSYAMSTDDVPLLEQLPEQGIPFSIFVLSLALGSRQQLKTNYSVGSRTAVLCRG